MPTPVAVEAVGLGRPVPLDHIARVDLERPVHDGAHAADHGGADVVAAERVRVREADADADEVELGHLGDLLFGDLRHGRVPGVGAALDERDEGVALGEVLGVVEEHDEVVLGALLHAREGGDDGGVGLVALVSPSVLVLAHGLRHAHRDVILGHRERVLLLLQHHLLVPDPRQQVLVARPDRDLVLCGGVEARAGGGCDVGAVHLPCVCGLVYIHCVFDASDGCGCLGRN